MAGIAKKLIALDHRVIDLSKSNVIKARVSTELGWLHYEMGELDEAEAMAGNAIEILSQESETGDV